jgi:hypothetical protein
MAKPKSLYAGDGAIQKLLNRYDCPTPFHVVRMRFWGEIVSPAQKVSPVKTIESLWPEGLPTFDSAEEANAFFQALMGTWNHLAGYQSGSRSLKLTKVGAVDTREGLHAAAKIRVEELYEGFMRGFTGGQEDLDVPAGVGDLLTRIEKGIELLATARNTFARPPGPEDADILAELSGMFPVVDRALHHDLSAIAEAVTRWRSGMAPRGARLN